MYKTPFIDFSGPTLSREDLAEKVDQMVSVTDAFKVHDRFVRTRFLAFSGFFGLAALVTYFFDRSTTPLLLTLLGASLLLDFCYIAIRKSRCRAYVYRTLKDASRYSLPDPFLNLCMRSEKDALLSPVVDAARLQLINESIGCSVFEGYVWGAINDRDITQYEFYLLSKDLLGSEQRDGLRVLNEMKTTAALYCKMGHQAQKSSAPSDARLFTEAERRVLWDAFDASPKHALELAIRGLERLSSAKSAK